MTHLAFNQTTGEVLTTNRANHLKRWVARHTASDKKWAKAHGVSLGASKWMFAHGGSYTDCIAKLSERKVWG